MLQKWVKKFLWTLFHLENFQFSSLPGLVRSSPFLPAVATTTREKMAAFQALFDEEEEESEAAQDGDRITTGDHRSDGSRSDVDKENHPPASPTPSKRRRLGPSEGCGQEIREAGAPIRLSSLKEREVNEDRATRDVTEVPPSGGAVDESHRCVLFPQSDSPSRKRQDGAFEEQSPSRPPPVGPAAASPPRPSPPFHIPSFPSPLQMKPAEDDGTSATKKKQVRFGGPLSPEFFDRHLPPSMPLQKGGTPVRAAPSAGSFQLQSLLKTPQRSPSDRPRSQPDLGGLADLGASPTFSLPRRRRQESQAAPEPEAAAAPATTSSRSGSRKRKQRTAEEESQPARKSTRSAGKLASGKMKTAAAGARHWRKDVDRSLYGSRVYASKKPELSPIGEDQSPAAPQTPPPDAAGPGCQARRRSLRLSRVGLHSEDGAGLAWMAPTSPAAEPRRRTRDQQLSAGSRQGGKKRDSIC